MGGYDSADGGGGIDPRKPILALLSLLALILIVQGLLLVLPDDVTAGFRDFLRSFR